MKRDIKFTFTPTRRFFSEEFKSVYEPGLFYTVHEVDPDVPFSDEGDGRTNALRALLAECAQRWIESGLVEVRARGIHLQARESSIIASIHVGAQGEAR